MYRRLLYIVPAFSLGLLLLASGISCTGCGGNKEKRTQGEESPINPMVARLDDTPDEAVLVRLNSFDSDSMYVTVRASGRKWAFAYGEAMANGMFHGTMRKGDTYSLLPDNRRKTVTIAVNTTELSGKWVYDQQQHRGLAFNQGGGMESVNAGNICFREWKLLNGKMYIYYVDTQQVASDRQQYLVEEAYINTLSAKELIIQFRGERLRCLRPSDKPLIYEGK